MTPNETLGLCCIPHITQLMTQTTNLYMAAACLAIMLLSILACCRGKLRVKECLYHHIFEHRKIRCPSGKLLVKFSDLFLNVHVLQKSNYLKKFQNISFQK